MSGILPPVERARGEASLDDSVFAFGGDKGAAPRGFHDAVARVNRAMATAQRQKFANAAAESESLKYRKSTEKEKKSAEGAVQLGDCKRYVDARALGKWFEAKLSCSLSKVELVALIDVFGKDYEGVARLDQLLLAVLAAGSRAREKATSDGDVVADKAAPKTSEIKTKAVSKGPKLDNLGREVKEEGAGEEISREEMDAYRRSSLSKLAAAARNYWFRRGSMAGDPIDRMRGGAMDSDTFGHNLKISFHLNLHPVELQHLIQIFDVDGDGKVDGAEFVSLFLRLVDEERKKQVRAKAAAKQRREDLLESVDFKPKAKILDLSQVKWKQSDLRRGAAKLAEAALMSLHNRMLNTSDLERAFHCGDIEPGRFVSLAHTLLGVKLRAAEAAAVITTLAKGGPDKDPKGSSLSNQKNDDVTPATTAAVDGRKFLRLWRTLAREEAKYRPDLQWHN